MPKFSYKAISAEGQTITGSLNANARTEAIKQLKAQGYRPLKVEEGGNGSIKSKAKSSNGSVKSSKKSTTKTTAKGKSAKKNEPVKKRSTRVSRRDIQVFTNQLAALMRAGIVLSHSLKILEQQSESEGMAQILHDLYEDIHSGSSLSEALQKHPKQFSKLYCSMVRVGESGGVLETVLKQLAGFMEAENNLRSNITTAMAYPTLVSLVGLGSIFVLIAFVIPRLGSVFADFGDNLPWLTSALINFSNGFLAYWWLFALMLGGLIYGFRYMNQSVKGREFLDRTKERIPGVGTIIIKSQISRFARTMGTLIKSGIPVLNSLYLVVDTTSSVVLENHLREISEKVKKGEGLSEPMRETGFFPPMVTNLIAVGEESGSLDEMLFQVAETYDQEVQHAIKRFITMFEPAVIVLMAIGVGGILFAFLLPILNIGNMVQ